VLTRFLVSRRAAVEPTSWTPCPRRGPVALSECYGCDLLRGIAPSGRGAAIICEAGELGPVRRTDDVASSTSVMRLMARDIFCVTANATLDVVAEFLAGSGLGEVPVVDANGNPLGVVSRADLASQAPRRQTAPAVGPFAVTFLEGEEPSPRLRTAADVMRPVVLSLHYRVSIATAAAIMSCHGMSRILILDDRGAVCGILTAEDLAHGAAEAGCTDVDDPPA
jgi:CBS domain-containing protein